MEKLKLVDAIQLAGSVASLTGLSLLAIGQVSSVLEIASILSYLMSVSIFIGIFGLIIFFSNLARDEFTWFLKQIAR